jgi:hypothetical protein
VFRRFHGNELAIVGWDPENLVDPVELELEWLPDGGILGLSGLVLSDTLVESWQPTGFMSFEPGCSWIPYRGTPNI